MITLWQDRGRTLFFEPKVPGLKFKEKACAAGRAEGVLCLVVFMVMWQLWLPARIHAQEVPASPSGLRIISSDTPPSCSTESVLAFRPIQPHAVAVSTHGKCDCSEDGVAFTNLERGRILEQGVVIRTGEDGWTDVFFHRTGITVRLQAGTEIRLEKIAVSVMDGRPALHILLDFRKGRILAVVRATGGGGALEIGNAAGRSVVEGNRNGRYIITADGIQVSDKMPAVPLKLIGENGIRFLAAGEQLTKQDGKSLSVTTNLSDLAQLDELQKVAERLVPKERSHAALSANAISNAPAAQVPLGALSEGR